MPRSSPALCRVLGHAESAKDDRFSTNPSRVAHRDVVIERIQAVAVTRTTADWMALMEAAGVPCGPINGIDSVFDDIQVQARGMRVEMAHPLAGRVPLVANPIRMSESPVSYRLAPPLLGDDSDAIVSDWLNQDR